MKSEIIVGTTELDVQLAVGEGVVQSTPPVERSGRPFGMISTHVRKPHKPSEQTFRQIDMLARQATGIIERTQAAEALKQANQALEKRVAERTADLELRSRQLQKLALDLIHTENRERRHLAEILHDDFQQDAAYLKIELDRLAQQQADTDMRQQLARLAQFTANFIGKMRHLSYALNLTPLHRGGLLAALEVLSRDMRKNYGLTVTLHTQHGAEPASRAVASMLYRSIRELLLNVVKHAGVNTAVVDVRRQGESIQVKVTDMGQGFDYPAIRDGQRRETGFGLYSIEERMISLGGTIQVTSKPGKGSCVVLTVRFVNCK